MKIRNILALLLVVVIFSACMNSEEKRKAIVDNYIHKVGKDLSKKHKMLLNGGFEIQHAGSHVRSVHIDFQIFRPLTKNEARALILDCIQTAHQEINHNEKFKPYIIDGRYLLKEFTIRIFINPDKKITYYPNLGNVVFTSGKISYETNDPDRDIIWTKTHEEETLDVALAILEHQGNKDLLELKDENL